VTCGTDISSGSPHLVRVWRRSDHHARTCRLASRPFLRTQYETDRRHEARRSTGPGIASISPHPVRDMTSSRNPRSPDPGIASISPHQVRVDHPGGGREGVWDWHRVHISAPGTSSGRSTRVRGPSSADIASTSPHQVRGANSRSGTCF